MLISFRFCRILSSSPWLELLKPLFFFLSVRTQGRSSARFWLRPRWSWTNWWRRSARLWTSQSLTGRPAGWPDRSVNSAWREGWWNHSEQFRCQAEALVHSVLWNWELTKSKSYSVLLGYVLLPQILCLCIVSAGKILAWWATSSKSLTQRQTKRKSKKKTEQNWQNWLCEQNSQNAFLLQNTLAIRCTTPHSARANFSFTARHSKLLVPQETLLYYELLSHGKSL